MADAPAHPFARDPEVVTHEDTECPPLTDEMVRHAEEDLGVRLPAAYVDLMRRCNGGYFPSVMVIPTPRLTTSYQDKVHVEAIKGIPAITDAVNFGVPKGILCTRYMIREWELPEGLVLLEGDGHTWIALDYRKSGPDGPPSVAWLNVEVEDDLTLAASFEDFINDLRPAAEIDDLH